MVPPLTAVNRPVGEIVAIVGSTTLHVIGNVGVLPTTITPSISGGNINLTFPTQSGKTYTVLYKNLLTDLTWSTLATTNGTGANAVVSYPSSGSQRYYRLSIQ